MTDDDTTAQDDDEEALRYPALPLAFQTTSPFISSRAAEPPATPPVAETPQPPSDEPWGMLDVVEPPVTYGVDELALLARDPWTLFTWWEATASGLAAARAELGGEGALVLRLHVAAVGLAPRTYDVLLEAPHGQRYLGAPRAGAHVVAALGLRGEGGRFAVIARAPRVLVPYSEPGDGPVEWMEVAPTGSRGARFEPPVIVQHGPAEEIVGHPVPARVPAAAAPWVAQGTTTSPTGPSPTSPSPTSPGSKT